MTLVLFLSNVVEESCNQIISYDEHDHGLPQPQHLLSVKLPGSEHGHAAEELHLQEAGVHQETE